jgi:hypothetical protein
MEDKLNMYKASNHLKLCQIKYLGTRVLHVAASQPKIVTGVYEINKSCCG